MRLHWLPDGSGVGSDGWVGGRREAHKRDAAGQTSTRDRVAGEPAPRSNEIATRALTGGWQGDA